MIDVEMVNAEHKKLLDYSTHRATTSNGSTTLDVFESHPGQKRRRASSQALHKALSKTQELLALSLPSTIVLDKPDPALDKQQGSSRRNRGGKQPTRPTLSRSCSDRLRDSFRKRQKDLSASDKELELLEAILTHPSTNPGPTHRGRTPPRNRPTSLRSTSDPSHDVVPVSFRLKRTSSLGGSSSHHSLDESSTHRLHKHLLGMHLDQSSSHSIQRSKHGTSKPREMAIPEDDVLLDDQDMDASISMHVPDHRRMRERDLQDSFDVLMIAEEDEQDCDASESQASVTSSKVDSSNATWVTRPKTATDIATKAYKRYNSLALSLSGSEPSRRQRSLSPKRDSTSSQTHYPGVHSQSLHSSIHGFDLSNNVLGSNSERSRSMASSFSRDLDLKTLLKEKTRQRCPPSPRPMSPSSTKMERLNESMSNFLNESNNDLLSMSLNRQPSLLKKASLFRHSTGSEQRNARWSQPPGAANTEKLRSSLELPRGSKLALLASLNRSASDASKSRQVYANKLSTDVVQTSQVPRPAASAFYSNPAGKSSTNLDPKEIKKWLTAGGGMNCSEPTRRLPQNKPTLKPPQRASLMSLANKVATNTMAPVSSSRLVAGHPTTAPTTGPSRPNKNFQWQAKTRNGSIQPSTQATKPAANPFLAIINSKTNATRKHASNRTGDGTCQIPLPASLQSNKRIKVLAPDGVTTLSRNSSFASVNNTVDEKPRASISSNKLYQMLLKTNIPNGAKASSLKTSASDMNLEKPSKINRTISATRLGAQMSARRGRPRNTSRANLMADSYSIDPSHFVTGSRIRRFQSSNGLSLF